jgi:hypothetical protein
VVYEIRYGYPPFTARNIRGSSITARTSARQILFSEKWRGGSWSRRRIGDMAPILPPDHEPIPGLKEKIKDTLGSAKDAAPKLARAGAVSIRLCPSVLQVVQPCLDLVVQVMERPVVQAMERPVMQAIQQPQQADDPPREDYSAPVSYSLDRGVQSTSSDMPFNGGDWPVPRSRPSNAHLMMSSTNAALLFGSSSSSGMPFNNYHWPVPRRQTPHSSQMMFSTSNALLFGNS